MIRPQLNPVLTRRWGTFALLLSLSTSIAAPAKADPQRVQQEVHDYLRTNNLPSRPLTVTRPDGTQLSRTFVPVLANTQNDFLARFNTDRGAVIWRHLQNDPKHANLMLKPADHIGFTKPPHFDFTAQLNTTKPGCFLVMAMRQREIQHMVGRFEQVGTEPMHTRAAGVRITGHPTGPEGCMWWLVRAETAPGVNLATTMGVRRSMAPENLIRKLLHQGNERVQVVGVPVGTVEDFNGMNNEQLLGPAPGGQVAQ